MAFTRIASPRNPEPTNAKHQQVLGPLDPRNINMEHTKTDDTDTAKARTNVIDAWQFNCQVGKRAEGECIAIGGERGRFAGTGPLGIECEAEGETG